MAELFLVRHGQASLGTDNYDQLSDKGSRQAAILAEYFTDNNIVFDQYISGAMQRHKQTISPIVDTSKTVIDHGWNEFDFEAVIGAYVTEFDKTHELESGNKKVIYKLLKEAMLQWSQCNIKQSLPETWVEFNNRVSNAASTIRLSNAKRVLVSSSGGAIAAFIGSILNLTPSHVINLNLQIRNASIHRFFFNENGFQLSEFNSVPHFSSAELKEFITYS